MFRSSVVAYGRPDELLAAEYQPGQDAAGAPGFSVQVAGPSIQAVMPLAGGMTISLDLGSAEAVNALRALAWLETKALPKDLVAVDAIRRLALVLRQDPERASHLAAMLSLPKEQADRLKLLVSPPVRISPAMKGAQRQFAVLSLGPQVFRDLVLMAWAEQIAVSSARVGGSGAAPWLELLRTACAQA